MRPMKTVYEVTIESSTNEGEGIQFTVSGPNAAAGIVQDWAAGFIGHYGVHNSVLKIKTYEIED